MVMSKDTKLAHLRRQFGHTFKEQQYVFNAYDEAWRQHEIARDNHETARVELERYVDENK